MMRLSICVEVYCCLEDGWGRLYLLSSNVVYCRIVTGTFMQANIDEQLFLKFNGDLVELLIQVDPTYQPYIMYEGKQPILYTELDKALYGTLQATLLFWQKLSAFLIGKHGLA